ncbi:putative cobalamin binding protein [Thermoplasmatales archaeon BRNA1]|nr:putative cobalamin binding protein [Thermoplasmatales archaeon BRNA1]
MSDTDAIIADLKKSIETWNVALVKEATQKAIDAKIPVNDIMDKGLGKGMETIGVRFDAAEIYLPQVVAASKTMEVALKMLEPLMAGSGGVTKGTVVMGTVEGDIHEIGKNVCCAMLRGAGYNVIDIGPDADSDAFLEAAEDNDATILGGSALMTTTLEAQRELVIANKEAGGNYKCIFGGAPCSKEWCDEIGADGYSETGAEIIGLCDKLMS